MPVSSSTEHWIKPDALTINLNHFGDPDYLQVSVLAGAVVMAFKQDVIGYNAAHNYRTWPLEAANTYLETSSAVNVYAKLTRSEVNARALIAYDTALRDIEGREITYAEDGSEILGEPNPDLYYVYLGQISASVDEFGNNILREWALDIRFGTLNTNQYQNEDGGGEWTKMFRLNKVTGMIDVLKTFSSAIFKRLTIGNKEITDVQRSEILDEDLKLDNNTIPTTQFTEDRYLSKVKDDRSTGTVASDKGFEAGDFVSGATGTAVYKDKQGAWHIETDNLHVRRKFSANDIEIQTTNYIGGQTMLSAASMKVDSVEELTDRYRCLFRKKNGEGDVVRQEWKVGDCAYCNTFNLESQADGTMGNHFFWREVVGVSKNDWNDEFHYVELSKSICASGSSAPKSGDKVVHLGYNKTDEVDRQNAIVIAGAGTGSPYIHLFVGIKNFRLPEPEQLKPGDNRLSGVLSIKSGSTGWQNLSGLPDSIQNAVDLANKAQETIDNTSVGAVNLLRNSGFTGNYESENMEGVILSDDSELYSKTLKYWDGIASVRDDSEAVSGKSVEIGSISQAVETIKDEYYVISFKAKGSEIAVSCGGYHSVEFLTSEYKRYEFKFQSDGSCGFLLSGTAKVCDLQLERGTIATDWNASPYDNDKTLAEFQALKYIQDAIVNGSTDIIGGLILTSMLKLGNYKDGVLQKVNAGVSGIYNDADDVAFWAGGALENALRTAIEFKQNPNFKPTMEQWKNLANFVVTHGGDLFLRGNIYAENGYFRGDLEQGEGKTLLSKDGSGHLADRMIHWNKYGVMYRKAHEIIEWVNITDFKETHAVDLKEGYYLDLSLSDLDDAYTLPNGEYDGQLLTLRFRYNNNQNRREGCAVLNGTFSMRKYYDDIEQMENADRLILDAENVEFQLVYSSTTGWTYYGEGASISGVLLTIGKVKDVELETVTAKIFKVEDKEGISKTITIQETGGTARLVFTGGILTSYSFESKEE